jgi:hypothetical protein
MFWNSGLNHQQSAKRLAPISISDFTINKPLVVIPAQAGIQYFELLLDARLRHAGITDHCISILR